MPFLQHVKRTACDDEEKSGLMKWFAMFVSGLAAILCVGLVRLKVQHENLQPTLLLNLASIALIALGFGLPLMVTRWNARHRRS